MLFHIKKEYKELLLKYGWFENVAGGWTGPYGYLVDAVLSRREICHKTSAQLERILQEYKELYDQRRGHDSAKQMIYNSISDDEYSTIITILNKENPLHKILENTAFCGNCGKKIIIDLALKTGFSRYRFAEYSVSEDGDIEWDTGAYIMPSADIVKLADQVICQKDGKIRKSIQSSDMRDALLRGEI